MKFKQILNLIIKYKSVQTFKRKELLHKFIIKIIKTTLGFLKLMSCISCECYLIIQEEGKSSCGPDSKWNFGVSVCWIVSYLLHYNGEEKVEIMEHNCYTENLSFINCQYIKFWSKSVCNCVYVCLRNF